MTESELIEEVEALSLFIVILKRNYEELHADFASVLVAGGGSTRVPMAVLDMSPMPGRIARQSDPITGAAIFRFVPDAA